MFSEVAENTRDINPFKILLALMRLPILTALVEKVTFPTLNLADFSLQKYINCVVYIIHQ